MGGMTARNGKQNKHSRFPVVARDTSGWLISAMCRSNLHEERPPAGNYHLPVTPSFLPTLLIDWTTPTLSIKSGEYC